MVLDTVWSVFVILIAVFLIYAILPTLFMRAICFRGLNGRQENKERFACLTFDDGPNPLYTPRLLDLLKQYHVHATFFVVGVHAEKYPDLIRRMQAEGHLIAIHHYNHVSNWFLTPWGTKRQCLKAQQTIEDIAGIRPVYYRPPWGHLHLFLPLAARGFRPVLWSAILGDWRKALGKERLKQRITAHLRHGAVICLHDDGENPGANEDAPENTLQALTDLLPTISQHYHFVTVDSLYQMSHQTSY